ncbi:acyltransferase family protein [Paratractidigestivibacter faecalis]|uniref:acyltransferase family protein n=1 Tax=Paratractidigestivibacter faecalis TaxID=2292441 RepID=UPI003F98919D
MAETPIQDAAQKSPAVRSPRSHYVGALDGLRVLAILAVLVYHANPSWLPGGYFGVTVFFVLTGYLTTLSIEREIGRAGRLDYPRFVLKRVTRLLPSMLAVVGVSTLLCVFLAPNLLPKVKSDAMPALLFVENVFYIVRNVSYFANAGLPSPLTHFWYLGVVMQFYVVWPLVLLGMRKVVRSRRTACSAVGILSVASAVLMAVLYDPAGDTARIYYGPDTRAAELLLGALAALWTGGRGLNLRALPAVEPRLKDAPAWTCDAVALACLAGLGVMCFSLNGYSEFAYRGGMLLAAVLTAVLVSCLCRPQSALAHVLGARPVAEAGKRAFAAYLWHYPLLVILNPATRTTELPVWGWALEFLLIFACAEASYRLFEKGQGLRELAGRPMPLGLAVPQVAFGALGVLCALVLLVVPISAEQTGVPTEMQQMSAEEQQYLAEQQAAAESARSGENGDGSDAAGEGDGSQAEPQQDNTTFDVSGTYFAGTAFAAAIDQINATSFTVDASTGATNASVILIGDSVPAGAITQFYKYFPNGYIDAQVGRQLYAGLDVYRQCQANGHDGDVVVWAIGDNGVARESQVKELIEAVDPSKHVYLCTVRVPLALQDMNNQLFKDVAAQYDNVDVIDWYAESAGHDEYFWSDGTHLRPEGAEAYILMLRKAITGR